jgi:hypothetical protein
MLRTVLKKKQMDVFSCDINTGSILDRMLAVQTLCYCLRLKITDVLSVICTYITLYIYFFLNLCRVLETFDVLCI